MQNRIVNVTEFKAKCLALLEEIGTHGGTITITKRGRPLAKVGPVRRPKWKSLEGSWAGKIDLPLDPVDLSNLWEAVNPQPGAPD